MGDLVGHWHGTKKLSSVSVFLFVWFSCRKLGHGKLFCSLSPGQRKINEEDLLQKILVSLHYGKTQCLSPLWLGRTGWCSRSWSRPRLKWRWTNLRCPRRCRRGRSGRRAWWPRPSHPWRPGIIFDPIRGGRIHGPSREKTPGHSHTTYMVSFIVFAHSVHLCTHTHSLAQKIPTSMAK